MFTSPNLTARARNAWLSLTLVIFAAFVVSLLPYVSNAGFQSTESQSNQKRPELRSVPGEILVRFRSHATIVKGAPREELLLAERQGAMVVSVERLRGPE